jgi:dolichol-phosphate mannosyltransferase
VDAVRLSVVIPAHNEQGSIVETVETLVDMLEGEGIDHEVLVVDDHSSDATVAVVTRIAERRPTVRCVRNEGPRGFGMAVRCGLEHYSGDAVGVMMADLSDSPRDLLTYWRLLEQGFECAFGSRFMTGSVVSDYPRLKLVLNRIVNFAIRVLFRHGYNDTTNAFKAYRREVIDNVQPLLSPHFNLTVEIPLKAIVRGHSYAVIPVSWRNRSAGESKLRLQEMGGRYLFIVLYVFLEHHLSRGDYHRSGERRPPRSRPWARPDEVAHADGGEP